MSRPQQEHKTSNNGASFYEIRVKNAGIFDSGVMKVQVIYRCNAQNEMQIQEYFGEINALYAKNKPFLILYDATNITFSATLVPMATRLMEFMHSKDEDTRRLALGCAVIMPNKFVSTALKPVLFFKPPACPMQIFDKAEAAQIFLQQHDPEKKQHSKRD